MKNIHRSRTSRVRRRWLLGASLPAVALASGLALSPVQAGDYNNDDERTAGDVATDSWITTKVKSQLLADQEVSGFDISVETKDNVVYLSGEVEDQSQVNHAVEIAEDTEGVERVDSTSLRVATAIDQVRDAVTGNGR
ncbi:MAG: BON domain-containing protein [Gammaproteobacteria bacterium]|nr:BON domain-containing protein [Gammaproteobacteria bacterium]